MLQDFFIQALLETKVPKGTFFLVIGLILWRRHLCLCIFIPTKIIHFFHITFTLTSLGRRPLIQNESTTEELRGKVLLMVQKVSPWWHDKEKYLVPLYQCVYIIVSCLKSIKHGTDLKIQDALLLLYKYIEKSFGISRQNVKIVHL